MVILAVVLTNNAILIYEKIPCARIKINNKIRLVLRSDLSAFISSPNKYGNANEARAEAAKKNIPNVNISAYGLR